MVYSMSPLAVLLTIVHFLESYLLLRGRELQDFLLLVLIKTKLISVCDWSLKFSSIKFRPRKLALADIEPDFTLTNTLYDNIELNWRNPPAQRFIDREVVAVVHGWITSSGKNSMVLIL